MVVIPPQSDCCSISFSFPLGTGFMALPSSPPPSAISFLPSSILSKKIREIRACGNNSSASPGIAQSLRNWVECMHNHSRGNCTVHLPSAMCTAQFLSCCTITREAEPSSSSVSLLVRLGECLGETRACCNDSSASPMIAQSLKL